MKIEGTDNIKYIPGKRDIETQDMRQMDANKGLSKSDIKTEDVVSYKKSSIEELFLYDPISIERLAEESEDFYGHLIKLVKDLVEKQAEVIKIIKQFDTEKTMEQSKPSEGNREQTGKLLLGKSVVDEFVLEELKESILPKGQLGVESTSEKVVSFVKMASDDKTGKMNILIDVIESTFKEIEDTLGRIPELSQRTYDRLVEKLDILLYETMFKEDPENAIAQLREMVKDIITEQLKIIEMIKKEKTVETRQSLTTKVSVDSLDISRAKELISTEGRLGEKSIAERVVGFIKLAAGQKGEGLDDLIEVIDKGFKELEQSIGILPQLTQKTQGKIKQELEDWEYMLQMKKHPGPVIFIENRNLYRKMGIKIKLNKRAYIFFIFALIIFFYSIKTLIQYWGQK